MQMGAKVAFLSKKMPTISQLFSGTLFPLFGGCPIKNGLPKKGICFPRWLGPPVPFYPFLGRVPLLKWTTKKKTRKAKYQLFPASLLQDVGLVP